MTSRTNIFSFLLFFIFSCAPYSPTTTSSFSTSSSYSVENIEDSIAPKYESGDLKYQPAYSSRKYVMENLNYKDNLEDPLYKTLLTDFYDFIPGVNNAIIDLSEHYREQIDENNQDIINILKMQKEYLWKIGFKSVAITEELIQEVYDRAGSACNSVIVDFYFEDSDSGSTNYRIKLKDVGFKITGCNNIYYTFAAPAMDTYYNTSPSKFYDDLNKVLFTQYSKAFWHDIPKSSNKRMTLLATEHTEEEDKRKILSSEWTEDKTKYYLDTNRLDAIEGIYEKIIDEEVSMGGKYKIGVIKKDNDYLFHYLDGANNYQDWEEGSLKAIMTKTANDNIYKVKWFMANKTVNDEVYGFIDEYGLLSIRFGSLVNEDGDSKYLKLYPISSNSRVSPDSSVKGNFTGSGTGFAISSEGYIVTNYHVIDSAKQIIVQQSKIGIQKQFNAEIILTDKDNDLAIIQIKDSNFDSLGNIPFTFKENISQMGSKVYTLGYPLINSMGESVKLTDGLISSKTGFQGDISSYQISVPVQPGNSGGPLFDYKGNLIGVVNAKHQNTDNVSYAIKSGTLKNLIELLPISLNENKANKLRNLSIPEQVELIEDFVFLIKTK